mgnify:CR=1 FL=1
MLHEIGKSILEITSNIKGGVLLFYTSYERQNNFIEAWKNGRILQYK